ncbi:MAG: DMT family transporter [Gammaproteobacteria bacterium]
MNSQTAMATVFVFLWSTGFIGARYGLDHAEPLTFLAVRFALVSALMLLVVLAMRAPLPRSPAMAGHIAVSGLLVHGVYLGCIFSSLYAGVSTGVSALIAGLQPLLTACVVGPLLGEHVTRRQWAGFALGFGGVVLVIWQQVSFQHTSLLGLALSGGALLGMTGGTLYQKRFCSDMDLRSGSLIQYLAVAPLMTLLALTLETNTIQWTPQFVFALSWLSLVLSVGAVTLLWILIRRGVASRVASLFYLVPVTTAIIAYFVFGETLSLLALAGMAVAVSGVALVNR